jgi:glycosyltransferase involved in cell wall biosynthesis
MFNIQESLFSNISKSYNNISENSQIIFVSDYFIGDYSGGAELTSQALIDEIPDRFKIDLVKSNNITIELLQQAQNKLLVFGNWSQLNPQLIPTIIANMKYVVLEYDYKYCKHRSPEKHLNIENTPCDCHNKNHGKMVSAFYYGAKALFWMSQKQMERYHQVFPFLQEKFNLVLSSVFDKKTIESIQQLRSIEKNEKYIILGSNSWVKGFENAKEYVENHHLLYEIVWNLPYKELLKKLASSCGHVYLPAGADTCPRLVIESKLLNCELILNDHVQHKNEEWFNKSIEQIENYLLERPKVFWGEVEKIIDYVPTLSGYTTTYNCILQEYPYKECISSMLAFCDEVCVVDGGSTDGTWDELEKLQKENNKLKLKQVKRDWNHPRFAVFDGAQKTEARKLCTCNFVWQMDCDEIVHENYYMKIKPLCEMMPPQIDIMCLSVIEGWGGFDQVRVDVNPWKARLSRNNKNIIHGIPKQLRMYDENGDLYARPGTDGCDMIYEDTGEFVQDINFWTQELENIRRSSLSGNIESLQKYENIINQIAKELPGVWHYSWIDLERKIKTYRSYWSSHWSSLFNQSIEDTSENNMFFDLPWSQVTDEMIKEKANELKEKCSGHIFHTKFKGQFTPGIKITSIDEPQIMKK